MTSVADIIEQMKARFNADAASGMDNVFQFSIEDGDNYYIAIKDGAFELGNGDHEDPSVTLILNSETLIAIMTGETDGMQAFMAGQLRAEGDMMLATRLGDLFPQ
ncbi:SCP2 sterol-binding domain-containing protein [Oceaniserpentilla sp. 4NH20-0058]|uniref:SCP2 sterol-binding domain-containing protein n=1 Tax=Oceaniserpentilla sp. 4NH20-0058 TaxID=3127660 RepID=UPI00310C4DC2